jgi:NDP-sugar pyrophosphorylase family protein
MFMNTPGHFFNLDNFTYKDLFQDVNNVWEVLKKIHPYLLNLKLGLISGDVSPDAYLINPELISIGKGTLIEPGAYIKGPCLIGENCIVRHGAYLRGDVIAGNGSVLGHDSEFKNALLLNNAHAAHFAYVGDSILGSNVNLGAGTKCANLKLSNQEVKVQGKSTGLRKFGAIIGDGCQIGCNSVLNPGTLIGPESHCYPLLNLHGVIPARSLVRTKDSIEISQRKW